MPHHKLTLRLRLTFWYMLGLSLTFGLFGSYLYFKFQSGLIQQIDTTLQVTNLEIGGRILPKNQQLKFKETNLQELQDFIEAGLVIRIINQQGQVLDHLGKDEKTILPIPQKVGFITISADNQNWRIYNRMISNHQVWLQVAQSLNRVNEASNHLLNLIILSCPLIIIFVGFGGWFLADRALAPIDQIIVTAESIKADDFTKRINYQGNFDEVGRLALTIDKMLDRLQSAFEYERRFTGNVSHELRTPLTVMKGKIDVILNRDRSLVEYQNTLQDLEKEVHRLIRLTNDLLFLTRLEQEEIEQKCTFYPVNISNLLDVLLEQLIELQPTAKNIKITSVIKPDLVVLGNGDYLTNLFLNLLDNGIKYTPDQGQISVKTTLQDQQIIIKIINTGEGIAQDHLPHLFERFYRVESARSRLTGGTGLGLAIAQEIAHLHQGLITVSSELGKNTTFEVILPNANQD